MKSFLNKTQIPIEENDHIKSKKLKGYYLFQLYIHSISEMQLAELIDGIFKIQVGEIELFSNVINELGTGQNVLIEQSFQTQIFVDHESDLDNTLVQIELNDYSRLLSHKKIVSLCFSLRSIYQKQHNQEINVWNVFVDHTKQKPFMGYINYSVCCQPPSQVPINLMSLHANQSSVNFKIPKDLKTNTKTLEIKVFTGELYQKSDFIGLADPYVKFTVGDQHRQTRVQYDTLLPEFNQIIYFKLMFPFALENLRIQLIDFDKLDSDDLLSVQQINLKDIVKGKYKELRYIYFYGGDEDGSYKDSLLQMNSGHGIPSKLKGKILLSMQFLNEEQEKKIDLDYNQHNNLQNVYQTIDEKDYRKTNALIQQRFDVQIYIESFQNVYLQGKFKIYLKWGKKCSQKKDYKIQFIYNELNLNLQINETFLINKNIKNQFIQIPDLYLYIERDNRVIKFLKLSYQKLLLKNQQKSHIYILREDYSSNLFVHQFPGLITCRINTNQKSIENDITLSKMPHQDIYLYCSIYQGRDLAGLDDSGLSDPQIFITYKDVQKSSSIQNQTINPLWNECIEIQSQQITVNKGCLIVEVFDIDKKVFGQKQKEFIGSFIIDLNKDQDILVKPTWYSLQQGQLFLGKILMSFKYSYSKIKNYSLQNMQQTEYVLSTEILGLRNLQQNALFQVKDPEIWLQNFKEDQFKVLKVNQSGENMNFCQTINIQAKLPNNIQQFPNYSILIKKNNFSFFESEKLIGSVTIDLQKFYIRSCQYIQKILQKYHDYKNSDFVDEIKKIEKKIDKFDENNYAEYETITKFKQTVEQINEDLVIYPKFKNKEINGVDVQIIKEVPDVQQYIQLGYKTQSQDTIHFRKFFDFELEQFLFIKDYLYEDFEILKGRQKIPKKFYDQFENFKKQKVQGNMRSKLLLLKQNIFDDIQQVQKDYGITLNELPQKDNIKEIVQQKYNVRIYILQAQFYIQQDSITSDESYYCIELQDKKIIGDKVERQVDPKFYKVETISFTLPGDQQLKISFYKNNKIFKDTLIGQTTIELEQRILNSQFNQLDSWLIESRQLKKIDSKTAEGIVMLGLDINPEDHSNKIWDISLQPTIELELRLIIWNLKTTTTDNFFDGTDIFVKVIFPGDIEKQTDTHNRSTGGQANFNYRMVAPLEINEYTKIDNLGINLKIFDADLFTNEYIAEANLEISEIVKKVLLSNKSLEMNRKQNAKRISRFKIKCQDKIEYDEEGNIIDNDVSEIIISLECLIKKDAEHREVGEGRDAPNQFPFLPEPKRDYQGFSIANTIRESLGPNFVQFFFQV